MVDIRQKWLWITHDFASKVNIENVHGCPGSPVVKTSSNAGGVGSIPGQGVKIPHALWPKIQNIEQKPYCNKFNKDFKKIVYIKKKIFKKYRGCSAKYSVAFTYFYKMFNFALQQVWLVFSFIQ